MRFRLKISLLLVAAVFVSVLLVTWENSRLFLEEQQTRVGDFQGALADAIHTRFLDSAAILQTQISVVLKSEKKPLEALREGLEGYLGGAVWERGKLRESDPQPIDVTIPIFQEEWVLVPGHDAFEPRNFGMAVKNGDRIAVVFLDAVWLDVLTVAGHGLSSGLIIGKATFFAGEDHTLRFPELEGSAPSIGRTRWATSSRGEKFLVTTLPLRANPPSQVVLALPSLKIFSVFRQTTWRVVIVTLVLAVLAAGISGRLASSLARPLKELESATQDLAKGNFRVNLPQLLTRADEFGSLGRAFTKMGDELFRLQEEVKHAERLSALGKFSASLAHEIKNPLTGVLMSVESAQNVLAQLSGDGKVKLEEILGHVIEDTRRANRKLSSLMKFARKDSPELVSVDIVTRVRRSLAMMEATFEQYGVKLSAELPSESALCKANEDNIHEVLLNLCQNACYAMKGSSKKELSVRVRLTSTLIELEVADTGSGMSAQTKSHLFEPFYTTKPQGEGTGLGLAACQGIIRNHFGSIHVESAEGVGTTFRITLPRADIASARAA